MISFSKSKCLVTIFLLAKFLSCSIKTLKRVLKEIHESIILNFIVSFFYFHQMQSILKWNGKLLGNVIIKKEVWRHLEWEIVFGVIIFIRTVYPYLLLSFDISFPSKYSNNRNIWCFMYFLSDSADWRGRKFTFIILLFTFSTEPSIENK